MSIYILNLIVVAISSFIAEKTSKIVNNKKKYKIIFILIATLSLILVSGFRYKVGTDYGNYSEIFIYLTGGAIDFSGEAGFNTLMFLMKKISSNPQMMFMITSIIINIGFVIFMVKHSDNIFLAMYFYITTFTYYLTMNGIRQYIASVVLVLGYECIVKGNFKKYLIYVIIACTFHSSAFMMIPVYFLVRRKCDSVSNIAIIFGTILAMIFYIPFLELIFTLLKNTGFYYYKDILLKDVNGANPLRVIAWSAPIILAFLYKDRGRKVYGDKFDIAVNLCMIGTVFILLATKHVFFARVSMYFDIYYVLLLPKLCMMFDSKTNRVLTVGIMFVYLGYSTGLLLSGDAWIYPYRYNFNLF